MTMPMPTSGWDTAGAVLLVLWALAMGTAVGVLAYANRRPVRLRVYRGALGVVAVGVLGQLGHVQEHVAQAGYWLGHPNAPAWMTPWGAGLAAGLQQALPDRPAFGMELLHLTGNFLFLAGLAGVMVLTRRARGTRTRRWAKMGVWMQGLHGLEHLVLTLSVAFGAPRAIGLSTFFGLVDPGPGLTTYRVWWHFTANVAGSIIFGLALYHLWRERRAIRATFVLQPLPAVTGRAA
ncbi:DUF6008 family protein [Amycolatopsis sp. CA-128772]|uniref:DUF6008 family protein n=1 Tax=Amycolatopsis sp. CA-128772 TaxID=2073159 RepID=UPI001E616861|nr:DUF6008 family protein [Amycolatopsis sp. CA-128772]